MNTSDAKTAVLYRMVMPEHVCPYGLKSKWQLEHHGFKVEDHWLKTREETDAFKAEHHVETTPQTFIDGERIGGNDDVSRFFGKHVQNANETSYRPVIAVFAMTALMAVALTEAALGTAFARPTIPWFASLSMCVLSISKLQDVERFSTMFLNYDLLARRWVPYSYLYPFGEALAGVLMLAGVLRWVSAPVAFVIGSIGAVSVLKAVYVDKRELKCACVGGTSNVPLGLVSLLENLVMVAMAAWMVLA